MPDWPHMATGNMMICVPPREDETEIKRFTCRKCGRTMIGRAGKWGIVIEDKITWHKKMQVVKALCVGCKERVMDWVEADPRWKPSKLSKRRKKAA
jgi:hypothetical protein